MKNAILIVCFLVGAAFAFGQTLPKIQRVYKSKSDCAPATQRMIAVAIWNLAQQGAIQLPPHLVRR